MSNVLIGIIGVILFIGLALAGALFLGPRFQEATLNSKGASVVQAVNQVANAANLAAVSNGSPTTSTTDLGALVSAGYLKTIPTNAAEASNALRLTDYDGRSNGTQAAFVAEARIPSQNLCAAIARQSGQPDTDVTVGHQAFPARTSGCFRIQEDTGLYNHTVGEFWALARI